MTTLIVEADFIIPIVPKYRIIKDGAIAIENDRIVFVGKRDECRRKFKVDEVISIRRSVALPGFINAHNHLFQSIIRNLGVDMVLVDWLRTTIHPLLLSFRDEDFYIAALWGIVENIKSGSTTIVDNHYGGRGYDYVAEALIKSGVRGCLARGIYELNVIEELKEDPDEALKDTERLIKKYHGANDGRLMVAVAPMHPYNCSKELLLKAKEISDKYGVPYHTHTAESKKDQELNIRLHGMTDVTLLHKLGVLSSRYHAVHAVNVSREEIMYLAASGAHVIHNPESNMYLASGIAPIVEMMREGVNIALGTDGPGSNNNQDMIEAMRFAAMLHKVASGDPKAISAWDVLEMATINGAKALGIDRHVGSLEPGKKADITVVRLDEPHTVPIHDPVGSIVYCANACDVDTVIVDGRVLMKNRRLLIFNEEEVKKTAEKVAAEILSRAKERYGIKPPHEDYLI